MDPLHKISYWDSHEYLCETKKCRSAKEKEKKMNKKKQKKKQKKKKKQRKQNKSNDNVQQVIKHKEREKIINKERVKIIDTSPSEAIWYIQTQCKLFMVALHDAIRERCKWSDNLYLMGMVFDWEEHLLQIEGILKDFKNGTVSVNQMETMKQRYINDWRQTEFKTLCIQYNKVYTDYGIDVDLDVVCNQFSVFKRKLWFLHERGDINKLYSHNKKEFKQKLGIVINRHNEVGRIFLEKIQLHNNLKDFLRVYTRSEVIGAAEGMVEGDVKKASNRLRNRTRISDIVFGWEHTICDLLKLYKFRLPKLFRKMAKEYKRKYPSQRQSVLSNPPNGWINL